jgi:hypothetical protein
MLNVLRSKFTLVSLRPARDNTRICRRLSQKAQVHEDVLILAAIGGFLGVALGAFGTHGLAARFAEHPTARNTYQTATQYLQIHALANPPPLLAKC